MMTQTWTVTALSLLSLYFFINACAASSLDLCPLNSNDTITPSSNITWSQVIEQPIRQFDGSSYLRPDIGTSFYRLHHLAGEML